MHADITKQVISIAGFGTFAIPTVAAAGRQGNFYCKKQWQVCTQSSGYTYDDTQNVRHRTWYSLRRVLSNIFSDIDVWTFNQAGSTNIGGAFAAQIKV
jgi:hypothetical protein